ncbi:autotransporter outer membrane beta-barrel domain-containing protein [Pantoea sp.]|uniref:autotransporter outer membrane beta-barrel domain-containing protein n=1 Tax=Pantoea sp. TaxID=69393 RepID=UPI0031D923B5
MAITVALLSPTAHAAGTIIANGKTVVVQNQDIVASGTGENVRGVSATNNGLAEFTNGTITTNKAYGHGAFAESGASIALNNIDITTSAGTAHGLYARGNASISGDGINISTRGAASYGLQTSDGNITLTNSSIKTSGTNSYGAFAAVVSGNTSISDTTINTTGDNAHAVYVTGGQMTVNNSQLSASGHTANGANAVGAGSTININNSSITTAGSSSEAVYAKNGGTVNLTNTNIFTDRINSYGLRTNGANATVNYDGGTITTTGPTRTIQAIAGSQINIRNATINSADSAVQALSNSRLDIRDTTINSENMAVDIEGGSKANLEGVTINANNSGVFVSGTNSQLTANNVQVNNSNGLFAFQVAFDGSANLDNIEINQVGNARGLEVLAGGTATGNNVRINIDSSDSGTASHALAIGNSKTNQLALSNSQITLNGANSIGAEFSSTPVSNNTLSLTDSSITATEGTVLLVAFNADTNVNTSGSLLTGATLLSAGVNTSGSISNVELTGDNGSVFNGDVVIDRANTAKNIINLANNSVWHGATDSLETLNVSSGSAWNVTRNSSVDNLTLDNGTLDMTAPGTGYSEVTIGNLTSNNGTIDFKTHLEGDDSVTDDLVITGDYSGNSNIVVKNAGGTGAQTLNGIELIRVDGDINGTFAQQGRIVAGAYDYHLVQDGNKWLLRDDMVGAIGGESGAPVIGDGITPVKSAPITRPETGSYAANLAAANTLFTTSLDDRLGETHYVGADGNKHSTSLWLRNAGGHTRFSDSSGQLKTTGNRYVMQLGGDIAQWSSNGDDRFHLGVMGGYANAQSNTRSSVTGYSAKGEVHGYSTGVYATWLQDNAEQTGAYVDSWMLYNWFDNSVKGQDIAPESYKSKGITASLEAGYSVKMAELTERSSFYLQPKAQVTWMGVQADDHQERNGTRVVGEGNNNVQTRLGMRAYIKGHNAIDDGKNRTFEPFIEANWIHNTETFGSSLNGVTVKQAGARNLGEVKVGVDAKLNNAVNLWGNIGQQMGDKGYSDSSAMVGVKVNF